MTLLLTGRNGLGNYLVKQPGIATNLTWNGEKRETTVDSVDLKQYLRGAPHDVACVRWPRWVL